MDDNKRYNLLFYFSITLLLIGVFGLTFGAFFALIGVPVFVTGAILLLFTKRKPKTKALWILGSILAVVLFWPIWTSINTMKPETYLIPEGFTGKVKVVYGTKCGIEPKVEDGRKVLEIPEDGILFVNYEFESGFIDHEYFIMDENGNRTQLEQQLSNENGGNNLPKIGYLASGSFASEMPNGGFSTKSPLTVHFSEFQVIRGDGLKHDFKKEQQFNAIIRTRIEECR